jgi:hypothetical protein
VHLSLREDIYSFLIEHLSLRIQNTRSGKKKRKKARKKSQEGEEIEDYKIRPMFSSNKRRTSAPFPKRPITRAKPFWDDCLWDFFQLL